MTPAKPEHGYTRKGHPVHEHTVDYLEGKDASLAVLITRGVGTMACAWVFAGIALISLPAAISSGSVIIIVSWVAQTLLQLVLLSIIMVGQNVQSKASDVRAAKTFEDVETVLDRLDQHTEGGLKVVLDRLDALDHDITGH